MWARSLWLVALMLVSKDILAKKLYKFQDSQGIWHYTDQTPPARQSAEVRQLKPADRQRVWLEKTGDENNQAFFVRNTYAGPIEVAVAWKTQENVSAKPALPRRFVVYPGQSPTLFNVVSDPKATAWRYGLQYRYVIGPPQNDYNGQVAYFPPLAAGSRFQITQGFNGEFSHGDPQNQYAVDIMMPENTPVHAARAGSVLDVETDFSGHGSEQAYASKANSIRILHDDGSMAIYAHLALEKAMVKSGEQVQVGQLIGYSGNTGLTTGPHLHFAVQINKGMELVSVPFRFRDENGIDSEPLSGVWVSGVVPNSGHTATPD